MYSHLLLHTNKSGTCNGQFFQQGENTMPEFEKVLDTTKAQTTSAFSPLSRFLIVLLAAMMSLATSATVLAQQPAQNRAQPHSAVEVRTGEDGAIRPFHLNAPQEALDELRRQLAATRWPDHETVTDRSQGVQLATMKELVRYWQTGYDWRKAEAKLNSLPQFVTTIAGLDIQFEQANRHRQP
jgi:hypothetical protein